MALTEITCKRDLEMWSSLPPVLHLISNALGCVVLSYCHSGNLKCQDRSSYKKQLE